MSKPTLYIRDVVLRTSAKSRLISESTIFVKEGVYPDYTSAVLAGQRSVGYANFYVDLGDVAPSREDQLLLPPLHRRSWKEKRMDDAALLD